MPSRQRTRKSATITLVAPPSESRGLRIRETIQRETLGPALALLRTILLKATAEVNKPEGVNFLLVREGTLVAELLLNKVVGSPRLPFDEVEAQGTIVVDTQTMLDEANATLAHLESVPLAKYLEASARGLILAVPTKESP